MVVVIGAQEDPGDPVQSLEASTTSSNASNVPIPVNICYQLSEVQYSPRVLLPLLMKFYKLQCYNM
jgi:hypothetical protein